MPNNELQNKINTLKTMDNDALLNAYLRVRDANAERRDFGLGTAEMEYQEACYNEIIARMK